MALRIEKKEGIGSEMHESSRPESGPGIWIPLLLAALVFVLYSASLRSDFVYDAPTEIMESSQTSWFDIVSFKVLATHLMLGDRPGQMLYLKLLHKFFGGAPLGYHAASNLVHAANVGLLFVLLRRMVESEGRVTVNHRRGMLVALAGVVLIFGVHPLTVEPVSGIGFSSDLLVVFFTLIALIAATFFRASPVPGVNGAGTIGTLSALAAVMCKESGVAAAALLVVYWFLFRRRESLRPWLVFLGLACFVTGVFLAARFIFALHNFARVGPLDGSWTQLAYLQPRLWVFMWGKLVWPAPLSADYTLENLGGLSTTFSLVVLALVVCGQIGLAWNSRLGALGVAMFWLGLAAVSNFVPLYRIEADRFYYLPLAGVSVQLAAGLLLAQKSDWEFRTGTAFVLAALVPLSLFNLQRQAIFRTDFSLWTETIKVSPRSALAFTNLGHVLEQRGDVAGAILHFQEALAIDPGSATPLYNLAVTLSRKGRSDEAIPLYQKLLATDPDFPGATYQFGNALYAVGRLDDAIILYQGTLKHEPRHLGALSNLGSVYLQKGQPDLAIDEYQKAVAIDPKVAEVHADLGNALIQKGRIDDAIAEYTKALEINPGFANTHGNLGAAYLQKGEADRAVNEYEKALAIDPSLAGVHYNMGLALLKLGRAAEAVAELEKAVQIHPADRDAQAALEAAKGALAPGKKGR